eukprot:c45547_g1_i1.p2 GENE.c45547_g1_i1~~c45547_g1_i1.p2  ORF type:complete len:106 (+),score=12.26 c45547_g1_i1:87-404(+)
MNPNDREPRIEALPVAVQPTGVAPGVAATGGSAVMRARAELEAEAQVLDATRADIMRQREGLLVEEVHLREVIARIKLDINLERERHMSETERELLQSLASSLLG